MIKRLIFILILLVTWNIIGCNQSESSNSSTINDENKTTVNQTPFIIIDSNGKRYVEETDNEVEELMDFINDYLKTEYTTNYKDYSGNESFTYYTDSLTSDMERKNYSSNQAKAAKQYELISDFIGQEIDTITIDNVQNKIFAHIKAKVKYDDFNDYFSQDMNRVNFSVQKDVEMLLPLDITIVKTNDEYKISGVTYRYGGIVNFGEATP